MVRLEFDEEKLLYDADANAFTGGELRDALLKALLSPARKPLVLFVHGRGDEPGKSLRGTGMVVSIWVEGRAVRKLAAYETLVHLVSWNSKRGGFGPFGLGDRRTPLGNADAGARRLSLVLGALKAAQEIAGAVVLPPVALVAHSMGTVVLQKAIERGLWPDGDPLLRHVVLTGADADNIGHATWLEKLAARERVWITVNANDGVLRKSTDGRPSGALPLGANTGPDLADSATYVDLDFGEDWGVHEVFNRDALLSHPSADALFRALLTGGDPHEVLNANGTRAGENRYRLA